MVSYSTDGIMPVEDLLKALAEQGRLSVLTRRYKRYRVSSQRPSPRYHTVEFLAIVDTSMRSAPYCAKQALENIKTLKETGQQRAKT